MKKLIIFLFTVLITSSACADDNAGNNNQMENTSVIITINGKEFNAVFYNNETANAFINMMPLTLNMSDLNGNEKFLLGSLSMGHSNPDIVLPDNRHGASYHIV